ncbi:MAG: hypothetical protein J7493_15925 [Porphyrobacter sp.]|nr:hypothetical protein [Porphyrobacter sp.]
MLWLSVALGVAGVGALRYAWSLPRRSPIANGAGWALLGLAVILAAVSDGAWGVSVAALAAMLTAFAALTVAGARSPSKQGNASNRRVGMLPESGEPKRIGRRVTTFLLLIVAGFAVSVGLGLAVRGLGTVLGWSESNANVLALYSVPVTWSVLVTVMLMQQSRRSQVLTLLACCVPVLPVLLSGVIQ